MGMRFALILLIPATLRPIDHGHRLTPRAEAR
jgi:hypothetical protein